MTTKSHRRSNARGLTAGREAALCGESGLEAGFRSAAGMGLIDGHDDHETYLEAVLEGKTEDVLGIVGWRPCRGPGRCRRAGRCRGALRPASRAGTCERGF